MDAFQTAPGGHDGYICNSVSVDEHQRRFRTPGLRWSGRMKPTSESLAKPDPIRDLTGSRLSLLVFALCVLMGSAAQINNCF